MPKYTVEVAEIWKRTFVVEMPEGEVEKALVGGESLASRIRDKANEMSGAGAEDEGFEYSDTLEPDQWTVRTEDGDFIT